MKLVPDVCFLKNWRDKWEQIFGIINIMPQMLSIRLDLYWTQNVPCCAKHDVFNSVVLSSLCIEGAQATSIQEHRYALLMWQPIKVKQW